MDIFNIDITLPPGEIDITNPLLYALPAFAALITTEIILSLKHERHLYVWKDLAASTSIGIGAAILATGTKLASLAAFVGIYELFNPIVDGVRTNIMGYESLGFAWYIWLLCQFLDDHNYYWYHRLSHEVRVLWAAHMVHHSSENFNLGSGIRNGWVTLFYKPLFWLWLPAVGFHPMMVATCLGIQAIYQFHLHTQYIPRLGFLERFMNTATQHRVHHASNVEYLDKNHGGFLNIFDKLYGTFRDYDEQIKVKYGVLHPPNSYNPLVIVAHEYRHIWNDVRKARNIKEAFMYIFGPPGWSPDGSTLTVKEMQRQAQVSEAGKISKVAAAS